MRSLLALSAALCALAGCNESDPEPLYVDVQYQLRCFDCEEHTNEPPHDIHHLDGDEGFALTCDTNPTEDGSLISFSAKFTDPENDKNDYGVEVAQAGLDDTPHGAGCTVKIFEGATTYAGRCADDEVDDDHPCEVALHREGEVVRGTLSCDRIPIENMVEPFRYLRRPDADKPAEVEVRGCVF